MFIFQGSVCGDANEVLKKVSLNDYSCADECSQQLKNYTLAYRAYCKQPNWLDGNSQGKILLKYISNHLISYLDYPVTLSVLILEGMKFGGFGGFG